MNMKGRINCSLQTIYQVEAKTKNIAVNVSDFRDF